MPAAIDQKYGYYIIKNTQHPPLYCNNKFEAVELAEKTNGWIEWWFHDEAFSTASWGVEPTESITDLYAARAKQLRNEYDYVILMYSGGIDSHNMLLTFLDHNIPLDEVCSFYSEYDSLSDSVINVEWELQTKPRLTALLKSNHNIATRRLNIGPAVLDAVHNLSEQYIYQQNNLAPSQRVFQLLHRYVDKWGALIEQGKKVALMFGIDKPRLRYNNKQWIYNFYDINLLPTSNTELAIEWFYWSPTVPNLPAKQAHIVKRFWEPRLDLTNQHSNLFLDFKNTDVQKLVYPACSALDFWTYSGHEVVCPLVGLRDKWLYTSNNKEQHPLSQLYNRLEKTANPKYFNNNQFKRGFVHNLSADYIVGRS